VAVRLEIHSWRWHGVPFLIRAGKCLPTSCVEVIVKLRKPPPYFAARSSAPNYYRFRISPDLQIALGTRVMNPGEEFAGSSVELLATHQHDADEMDAYERLLGDALKGDAGLFAREDTVEAAWRIVDPILGNTTPIHQYEPNTWGPSEADRLVAAEGGWHDPVVAT
jgi:glucose-6-phosphate 1-dehydrogenase